MYWFLSGSPTLTHAYINTTYYACMHSTYNAVHEIQTILYMHTCIQTILCMHTWTQTILCMHTNNTIHAYLNTNNTIHECISTYNTIHAYLNTNNTVHAYMHTNNTMHAYIAIHAGVPVRVEGRCAFIYMHTHTQMYIQTNTWTQVY